MNKVMTFLTFVGKQNESNRKEIYLCGRSHKLVSVPLIMQSTHVDSR